MLTGCSTPADTADTAVTAPASAVGSSDAPGVRVVVRFGDRTVAATLTDTAPARQFAAMLPLSVQLKDVWGQAKSGRLPRQLTVEGTTTIHDPVPGTIYFWPRSEVIAIYYDDIGQTVPDPGLVRLGVVESGLDDLTEAGNRFTVRIERDTATRP
jgi:hypothetical protein